MMLETHNAQCPYCGEIIQVLVDTSTGTDRYWEDCQVCCRPMAVALVVDPDGEVVELVVQREDD